MLPLGGSPLQAALWGVASAAFALYIWATMTSRRDAFSFGGYYYRMATHALIGAGVLVGLLIFVFSFPMGTAAGADVSISAASQLMP
uniref:Uncharacterized protein n=1 Tax=candidate division WWE3 bacterium TaxID=2053526 RepID=A0A832DS20_UNCKA